MPKMQNMTAGLGEAPKYRTARDLALAIGQSDWTARRILGEVFPGRDEPTSWRLGQGEWEKVLLHLATSDARRFGRRRRRRPSRTLEVVQ